MKLLGDVADIKFHLALYHNETVVINSHSRTLIHTHFSFYIQNIWEGPSNIHS